MSKLVAFEVLNLMTIEYARIEVGEDNIINLVGYNDSGKSALTRGLSIVLYDSFSNEQVKFIQDDKEYFGIGLEFDDGISINKYKYLDGKSEWEMKRGNEIIYTNRLDVGLAAMGDVPSVIAGYLNVVKDSFTEELVNLRLATDKLFLIHTSGGDNYKIINSVLRCDVLAEAVTRMNNKSNTLSSEVTNLAHSRATIKQTIDSITVLDDQTLDTVESRTSKLRETKLRYEYISSIKEQKQVLEEIIVPEKIEPVDLTQLKALMEIQRLKEIAEVPVTPIIPHVDTVKLEMLTNLIQLREELNVVIPPVLPHIDTTRITALENIMVLKQESDVIVNPMLPKIDITQFKELKALAEKFNDVYSTTVELSNLKQEQQQLVSQMSALSAQHNFKICNGCGTVVV